MESSVRSRAQAFVNKVSGPSESGNNNNPFVQVWDAVSGEEGYDWPDICLLHLSKDTFLC